MGNEHFVAPLPASSFFVATPLQVNGTPSSVDLPTYVPPSLSTYPPTPAYLPAYLLPAVPTETPTYVPTVCPYPHRGSSSFHLASHTRDTGVCGQRVSVQTPGCSSEWVGVGCRVASVVEFFSIEEATLWTAPGAPDENVLQQQRCEEDTAAGYCNIAIAGAAATSNQQQLQREGYVQAAL
jgi:hypothetical protein